MPFNPKIHHRRSIRLLDYDYSQEGLYFLTICINNGEQLLATIDDEGNLLLNDAGRMIEQWYFELENKFSVVTCHDYVVMPDHFHAIIEIAASDGSAERMHDKSIVHEGQTPRSAPTLDLNERKRSSLGTIIQWFKTMTTNEYIRGVNDMNWPAFDKRLWQRNYYEHIIRNAKSYQEISDYILNNPANWPQDKFWKK
jgi:REP element-mobilizing transposase RayT